MAQYDETQQALFEQIKRIAEDGGIERYNTQGQAKILESLTRAFRHAAGGAQPGGTASD
ncbi:MAG: hypothetical protein VX494_14745 [Actinomycetota bacterium]|nr:hypothetical protein [Actinomycetota bacterium]